MKHLLKTAVEEKQIPINTNERVYRQLGGRSLQDWYSVIIWEEMQSYQLTIGTSYLKPTKKVRFDSKIHKDGGSRVMTWSYSADSYTDQEILNDKQLIVAFINIYGDAFAGCSNCAQREIFR